MNLSTTMTVIMAIMGVASNSVQATSGYVECNPGNMDLILGAPHGGTERPSEIPERDFGCYKRKRDDCVWSHSCGNINKRK